MATRTCWVLALITLVWASIALADSPPEGQAALPELPRLSGPLTVARAVETALANNPSWAAALTRADAANASLLESRGEQLPALSLSAAATTGNMAASLATPMGVTPDSILNTAAESSIAGQLMAMYPVYTGGRARENVTAAERMVRAADSDVESARLEVALETKIAYREGLRTKAYALAYREYLAESEERLRIDQAAYDVGKLPLQYLLRDKAEVANARQMLANAERDAQMALSDLKTVMGVSLDSDIDLAEELTYAPAGFKLEVLLALAQQARPEVEAANQRMQAAGAQIKAADSAFRPQVNAVLMGGAMKTEGMPADSGYTVGLVVGMPLIDGGQRRARVSGAQAAQAELTQQLKQIRLQVANEVNKAWLALTAADTSVAAAKDVVASAEEDYRVAKVRYEAGKSVNVEVIDAQSALVRARANYIEALYDFNTALDRLERAVGGELPAASIAPTE